MSSRSSFVGVRNQTWRPEAARADERGVERVDRDVGRADEVDLLAARARGGQPQRAAADAPRDDVDGVEERVDPVREHAAQHGGLSIPSIDDEQLVQREPAAAAHPAEHAGDHLVHDPAEPRARRPRARVALGEEAVAPASATRGSGRRSSSARRSARRRGSRGCWTASPSRRRRRRRAASGASRRRRSRR